MPARNKGQPPRNRGLSWDQSVRGYQSASIQDVRPYSTAAIAIAQRPIGEWRTALAELPESERFAVRADLTEIYEARKLHAELDKALADRKDVWVSIPKGFRP